MKILRKITLSTETAMHVPFITSPSCCRRSLHILSVAVSQTSRSKERELLEKERVCRRRIAGV